MTFPWHFPSPPQVRRATSCEGSARTTEAATKERLVKAQAQNEALAERCRSAEGVSEAATEAAKVAAAEAAARVEAANAKVEAAEAKAAAAEAKSLAEEAKAVAAEAAAKAAAAATSDREASLLEMRDEHGREVERLRVERAAERAADGARLDEAKEVVAARDKEIEALRAQVSSVRSAADASEAAASERHASLLEARADLEQLTEGSPRLRHRP